MKKLFKRLTLVSLLLVALFTLASIPLMAQDKTLDLATIVANPIVQAILAGLLGIPLSGLIEMVKRALIKYLKINPDWSALGYLSSAITILAVAAAVMIPIHAFTIGAWLINSFVAWIVANGFYKETVKAPQGK